MLPAEFDYALPPELIARFPPEERRGSRLLVADAARGKLRDSSFAALPAFLRAGDLLVFNDTRVVKARLTGRKQSGGRVEILLERILSPTAALAQLRASKPAQPGTVLELGGGYRAQVSGRPAEFYALEFSAPVAAVLEAIGEVPLPPYLEREPTAADRERYQTVYAREDGAVAAPTAGLHFDAAMLEETRAGGIGHAYVTLHVGAGTFQPLRQAQLASGRLHGERVRVSAECCAAIARARGAGGRVVAVGTTAVRALETVASRGALAPFEGETDLFIRPGWPFRAVDVLLTNFHLPRSSLLMLVAAFGGRDFILAAYRHAVRERYRFFSYGDAMLVMPPPAAAAGG